MKRTLLGLIFVFAKLHADPSSCLPVEHEPITAHDLVTVAPVFARIPSDAPIAPAPLPGSRRVMRSVELAALARRYALEAGNLDDICFEWPMELLDRGKMLEAMQKALPYQEAEVEILETSLYEVPRGRIEFRYEDLGIPAATEKRSPAVWRGNVVYGGSHRFSIWARVMVSVRMPRMIAKETILRGQPILPESIRMEYSNVFPAPGANVARNLDDVVGQMPVRTIEAGKEVRLNQLAPPFDVSRGDSVDVEVRSGAARLALRARSESQGRSGETISLRNPATNRVFQAHIDGKGKASINVGALLGE